jgi:hypothetical protein
MGCLPMDYLCECSTDRDRREALEKLPQDLPSSYERILERAQKSNRQNQILLRNALHWIVYARELLKARVLLQALAVRDGDSRFDSSAMTTEEELLYWCSSLIRRAPNFSGFELAHFTVKEFLQAIDKPQFLEYKLSGDHWILSNASATILQCTKFDEVSIPRIESDTSEFWTAWEAVLNRFSFLEYSVQNAVHHSTKATGKMWKRLFLSFSTQGPPERSNFDCFPGCRCTLEHKSRPASLRSSINHRVWPLFTLPSASPLIKSAPA